MIRPGSTDQVEGRRADLGSPVWGSPVIVRFSEFTFIRRGILRYSIGSQTRRSKISGSETQFHTTVIACACRPSSGIDPATAQRWIPPGCSGSESKAQKWIIWKVSDAFDNRLPAEYPQTAEKHRFSSQTKLRGHRRNVIIPKINKGRNSQEQLEALSHNVTSESYQS